MGIQWDWIFANSDEVFARLLEHLHLTLLAVAIGMLISLPLGVFAYRHGRAYGPTTALTGLLYTIPSVALFAFLVPYTGLTTTTAEIGLVSYTLLILIRNVVAGLSSVGPEVKEAGLGMGLSKRQMLWRVELPLALPVIVAGVRLATVTTVGLVTVAAVIGKGGLGYFILTGLRRFDSAQSFWGAALSVALAIAMDALLLGAERAVTPWTRPALSRTSP